MSTCTEPPPFVTLPKPRKPYPGMSEIPKELQPILQDEHGEPTDGFDFYHSAPEALKTEVLAVYRMIHKERRSELETFFRMGDLFRRLTLDRQNNRCSKYGDRAVTTVSEIFRMDKDRIYWGRRVAQVFSEEEQAYILAARMRDGQPLTKGHVMVLSRIGTVEGRRLLLDEALAKAWTVEELDLRVRRANHEEDSQIRDGRGRPLGKPKDLDAAIQQQQSCADDFLARSEAVWSKPEHSLVHHVSSWESRIGPDQLNSLKTHCERLERLLAEVQRQATLAREAYEIARAQAPPTTRQTDVN